MLHVHPEFNAARFAQPRVPAFYDTEAFDRLQQFDSATNGFDFDGGSGASPELTYAQRSLGLPASQFSFSTRR
ncbi:hypothetical protein SH668x_002212 [Planctomicrobium sp. SH668]|uniref:hypothetical protein n=1 Tax=Planctomicrobium sp. SH668 TaxID=3448126 RepID=UPI003F5C243A